MLCSKRSPNCSACPLEDVCEYALARGPRLKVAGTEEGQVGRLRRVWQGLGSGGRVWVYVAGVGFSHSGGQGRGS